MQVFICGIIQGSNRGLDVHEQTYRDRIRQIIQSHIPEAKIYCPVSLHPQSPTYDDEKAFQVLEESVEAAKASDLLIAYLPQASMGSAIEMWEARRAGVKIVTITKLRSNWVIRYASDIILDDLDQLEQFVRNGGLNRLRQKT